MHDVAGGTIVLIAILFLRFGDQIANAIVVAIEGEPDIPDELDAHQMTKRPVE